MRVLASGTRSPSRETPSPAELMISASYESKESAHSAGSVPRSSDGRTTQRMGRSKARAKAKSRLSWAGTAMMAPVP